MFSACRIGASDRATFGAQNRARHPDDSTARRDVTGGNPTASFRRLDHSARTPHYGNRAKNLPDERCVNCATSAKRLRCALACSPRPVRGNGSKPKTDVTPVRRLPIRETIGWSAGAFDASSAIVKDDRHLAERAHRNRSTNAKTSRRSGSYAPATARERYGVLRRRFEACCVSPCVCAYQMKCTKRISKFQYRLAHRTVLTNVSHAMNGLPGTAPCVSGTAPCVSGTVPNTHNTHAERQGVLLRC